MNLENVTFEFSGFDCMAVPLTSSWISELIPNNTIGAYLLWNEIEPIYVGRSDNCLKTRLITHNHRGEATHVTWQVANTPSQAYQFECFWYSWAKQQNRCLNQIAPARPSKQNSISPLLSKFNQPSVCQR